MAPGRMSDLLSTGTDTPSSSSMTDSIRESARSSTKSVVKEALEEVNEENRPSSMQRALAAGVLFLSGLAGGYLLSRDERPETAYSSANEIVSEGIEDVSETLERRREPDTVSVEVNSGLARRARIAGAVAGGLFLALLIRRRRSSGESLSEPEWTDTAGSAEGSTVDWQENDIENPEPTEDSSTEWSEDPDEESSVDEEEASEQR